MNQKRNSINQIFIDRLNVVISQKYLTQSSLARICGITQSTISAYLLGKRSPGAEELGRIACALGVSMDWLWGISVDAKKNKLLEENIGLRSALKMAIGTMDCSIAVLKSQLD